MSSLDLEKETKIRENLKEPPKYACVLYNDDFTTMDFVVEILRTHFNLDEEKASMVMLSVHETGKGIAGVFTKDIAETKCLVVRQEAEKKGHPLKIEMEPQDS